MQVQITNCQITLVSFGCPPAFYASGNAKLQTSLASFGHTPTFQASVNSEYPGALAWTFFLYIIWRKNGVYYKNSGKKIQKNEKSIKKAVLIKKDGLLSD